ncbi:MAG: hypothetical protein H0U81_02690 [Pyrinomonadaceae bacterium]|nr:hypothetical protein [Pyrinomonadaceae bacterium]
MSRDKLISRIILTKERRRLIVALVSALVNKRLVTATWQTACPIAENHIT